MPRSREEMYADGRNTVFKSIDTTERLAKKGFFVTLPVDADEKIRAMPNKSAWLRQVILAALAQLESPSKATKTGKDKQLAQLQQELKEARDEIASLQYALSLERKEAKEATARGNKALSDLSAAVRDRDRAQLALTATCLTEENSEEEENH